VLSVDSTGFFSFLFFLFYKVSETTLTQPIHVQGLSVTLPADGLLHLALAGRALSASSRLVDEHIGDLDKLEVLLPLLSDEQEGGGMAVPTN
jgi:hypothetical protein